MDDFSGHQFKPGLYEHYKGGRYRAFYLVSHHETSELFVVYVSLVKGTMRIREWATPGRDSWSDVVDGAQRFKWIGR